MFKTTSKETVVKFSEEAVAAFFGEKLVECCEKIGRRLFMKQIGLAKSQS